ncbi:MAG: OmpA family protein [Rhodospirillaceae bacterium]|nr:OmpA family protein [Rhodospirillaceae bacterium]
MRLNSTLPIIAVTLLVSACGSADVTRVRALDVAGDGYDARLARAYKTLALFEADQMNDTGDARHFARKALLAAAGQRPGPEQPVRRKLPEGEKQEIRAAFRRLTAVNHSDARTIVPGAAARAQAGFDCWLEQQEENFQADHIATCRSEFYQALFEAEAAWPSAFVSFFELNSDALRGDAMEAVVVAARKALANETPEQTARSGRVSIVISGHADRAGSEAHNMGLSKRRADNARTRLIRLGIDGTRIAIRAHGEGRPLKATPDGRPEPRNRRVEIRIGLAPET